MFLPLDFSNEKFLVNYELQRLVFAHMVFSSRNSQDYKNSIVFAIQSWLQAVKCKMQKKMHSMWDARNEKLMHSIKYEYATDSSLAIR